MKNPHRLLPAILCLAAGVSSLAAQTTWIGADAASLTTTGNWDSGLPGLANTGTIPGGTLGINFNSSVTDWVVVQEGGTVSTTGFRQFNGGSWTMNGGTMSLGNNFQLVTSDDRSHVFTVNTGASASTTATLFVSSTGTNRSATLNISGGSVSTNQLQVFAGGTLNFTSGTLASSGNTTVNAGGQFSMTDGTRTGSNVINSGSLTISGGSFSTNSDRNLTTHAGGTTTISGGTVSIGASIGDSLRGAGAYVFTGGNTTMTGDIRADADTFSLTLGGTTAGTLTGDTWHVSTTYRHMDWLSGTLMSVTLSGSATWAETEWNADRLFFNGQSSTDLGGLSWADATNPSIGLGGGAYWVYDSGTNTLSLASGTPPSGPEIAVEQPVSTDIANGGSSDFGTVATGSDTSLTFTIRNTGTADLNLTGTPLVDVSGTDAADFTVTADPATPVTSGGGTTTFTVTFAPGAAGARSAVLSIANDDGNENPFTINLSGTGTSGTPYDAWANGAAFGDDANNDGVENGLAFLLGADTPTSAVSLPAVSNDSGKLVLTFSMRNAENRGTATLIVQHSSDLGIGDPWSTGAAAPTNGDGVTFNVTPGEPLDSVIAEISSDEAASGRLFGRLKAVSAP